MNTTTPAETVTVKAVTRYNGKRGYDVLVNGSKIGQVHRADRLWWYAASAQGVYGSGATSARSSAVAALVRLARKPVL